jgi:hypothetical protein
VLTSSVNQPFEIENLARQTASLSTDHDKLALGGSIISGDLAGYSAIAMVNVADNNVDFARHFTLANTISSVAHHTSSGEAQEIFAIATQDLTSTQSAAYLLRISATGEMLGTPIAVPLQAFAGAGAAALAHTSLLFDRVDRPILAFGHENRPDIAQIVRITLHSEIVESLTFEEFLLSSGDQASAIARDSDRVYLAGESAQEAFVAAVTLTEGTESQHDLIKIEADQTDSSTSQVTHVFHEDQALFGAVEIQMKSGDITQIALWNILLTSEG